MTPRFRLLSTLVLSGAFALTAAVGCQSFPGGSPRNELLITQVRGPHAKVTVDLSAMRSAFEKRELLSHEGDFQIATIRLTVSGPGIPQPLTASIPWTFDDPIGRGPSPGYSPSSDPPQELSASPSASPTPYVYQPPTAQASGPYTMTLLVPAGQNRVFKVEGLNCQGKVINTFRSLGTVKPNVDLSVKLNAANDAAARVLEKLLKGPAHGQTDPTFLQSSLALQDITAPLVAFVTRVTGYQEASNTFGAVSPTFLRVSRLIEALWAEGRPYLAGTLTPPDLLEPGGSMVTVFTEIPDLPAGSVVGSVEVRLFDPFEPYPQFAGPDYPATFYNVAPGTHTVMARSEGKAAWGTLTVPEGSEATTTLTLQPVTTEPCPGKAHSPSPSYSPSYSPPIFSPSPSPSASASAVPPIQIFTDLLNPMWSLGANVQPAIEGGVNSTDGLHLTFPGVGDQVVLQEVDPVSKAGLKALKFDCFSSAPVANFTVRMRTGGTLVGNAVPFAAGNAQTGFEVVYLPLTSMGIADASTLQNVDLVFEETLATDAVTLTIDNVVLMP